MSLTSLLKPSELAPQETVDAVSDPPESGTSSEEKACSLSIGSRQSVASRAVVCSDSSGTVPGEAGQGKRLLGGGGSEGGGGVAGTSLLLGSPYGPRQRRAGIFLSLNRLGTEGTEAEIWQSASNIGRGGGGSGGRRGV